MSNMGVSIVYRKNEMIISKRLGIGCNHSPSTTSHHSSVLLKCRGNKN